jgi:outer membrane lipoprotein-sorting protein
MKINWLLWLGLMFYFGANGMPRAADRADDLQSLRQDIQQTSSIQASFTQEKNLDILIKPLISKGLFFYQAPDSLRWEYLTPLKSLSLVHAGQAERYTFSKQAGFVKDASANTQALGLVMDKLTAWLAGKFTQDTAFEAKLLTSPQRRVVLTPRQPEMAKLLQKVELVFGKQDALVIVTEVIITENAQASTRIRFENVKLNQALDEKLFTSIKHQRQAK